MGKRILLWGLAGLLLIAGLAYSFRPLPVPVDLVRIEPGPLQERLDEDGMTRVRDVFVVSAPVNGRVLRIQAEIGDPVNAGRTVLAEIEPIDASLLDPRTAAQARADLNAAESALALAKAEVEQARAELEFADAELKRARVLLADETIAEREFDSIERNYKTRRAALSTALANVQVRNFDVDRARAQLMTPVQGRASGDLCECMPVVAPVDGRVLGVLHESEGVVTAGQPLVEVGDPSDLEIVVDLLSADAVRVKPGQRVIIEEWGEAEPLEGRVRRVDVVGYTKVSALGIEEQRVDVIVDLVSPRGDWQSLGHKYQLDAGIVLWESDAVLTVPLTALFRDGEDWAVFEVVDERAVLRKVRVGRRTNLRAQILDGLDAGALVVAHPGDQVEAGVRLEARR